MIYYSYHLGGCIMTKAQTTLLWVKAGGRCEFEGCNKLLYKDSFLPFIERNLADKAHIVANKPKGPRGNAVLSPKLTKDINNLMLTCKDCHDRIDHNQEIFTIDKLREMKKRHEERIERITSILEDNRTNIIIYWANIGRQGNPIDINKAQLAVVEDSKYPAVSSIVDLSLSGNASYDNEDDFWKMEKSNLEKKFNEKLKDKIADKSENQHYSVFALAPIPLLIKLGSLLTDKTNVQVYQRHREPRDTWEWLEVTNDLNFSIIKPQKKTENIALILSISSFFPVDDVTNVLGDNISIWQITIENQNNDCIKSKEHLSAFRKIFRAALQEIKKTHGANTLINIFPAVPLSVAIEMGRVWMPKADLPMCIYDRNRGEGLPFIKRISIGDENG